jgi:RimJ/RimL family protein N-acetyltransferase
VDSTVLPVVGTPAASALVLRPWGADDIEELIELCRDPGLRRYTSARVDTVAEGKHWVQVQETGWAAGERFSFAVHDQGAAAGGLVGNVVLKEFTADGSGAEVGYWTAARARGRSVAPRALEVLTEWAFDTFAERGLERLVLRHQVDNPASCRVAQKCRFALAETLAPAPPRFPLEGHLHVRRRTDGELPRGR